MVEFARLRGVRVMLEVDTPGHARSWCAGHPEVCPARDCKEPLNVANNATFELIEGLLRELTTADEGLALFPERLLHLGGDEVRTHCWTSVPQVPMHAVPRQRRRGGVDAFIASEKFFCV